MKRYFFQQLWFPERGVGPREIAVDEQGWVTDIRDTTQGSEGAERISGLALPGVVNVHSHAFQRAMAGLAEDRGGAQADSFWTWRDNMYRLVQTLGPEDIEAIAEHLFVEMLEAGYTSVGEFHYLHHDPSGRPYEDRAELSGRLLAAAQRVGIRMTLLPVLYRYSGFGQAPPQPAQRRFENDPEAFLRLRDQAVQLATTSDLLEVGAAFHSLRAVAPDDLEWVARQLPEDCAIHIHIAEQPKEVDDCVASLGARPVAWLLDHAPVDARWCLVHATHVTPDEVAKLAHSGAVAGFCPTTEANLGDGIAPAWELDRAGGSYALGSDSHITVDAAAEARWLEYGQRLSRGERASLAPSEGGSTGQRILSRCFAGGHQALALARIPADFIVLDQEHPQLTGVLANNFVDTWVFASMSGALERVMVGGTWRVEAGKHPDREAIADRYRQVRRRLASR